MNLPEYRKAYRMATERYQSAVSEATERLAYELMAADEQFFEDQDLAVEVTEKVKMR